MRSTLTEGSYLHDVINLVVCGALRELTKLWLTVSFYGFRYFKGHGQGEGLIVHIILDFYIIYDFGIL